MAVTATRDATRYEPATIRAEVASPAGKRRRHRIVARRFSDKPKYYLLDFFPYPSGDGLHVATPSSTFGTDVATRFLRMRGYNVLHPMGWDAFGLPAENEAIIQQIPPAENTAKNVANFKRQLRLQGISYDWTREINSSQPDYYRWTQWLFLLMYRRGLAYRAVGLQWWCPQCKTILANEQVENGYCWRHTADQTRSRRKKWNSGSSALPTTPKNC